MIDIQYIEVSVLSTYLHLDVSLYTDKCWYETDI